MSDSVAGSPIRVGLFVTCLVDLFRPSVGFAAVKLLEGAGCRVEAPAFKPVAAGHAAACHAVDEGRI